MIKNYKNMCSVDGCNKPSIIRGLCGKHYQRFRKHGTTDVLRHKGKNRIDIKDNYAILYVDGNEFIFDKEDVERVSKYTWFLRFGKAPYPCAHVRPYGTVPLSRFLIEKCRDKDRTIVCDHIDRNPFNNRKSNLRICSASINSLNKNAKGYNVDSNGTYRARICINGKRIGLGSYKTKEEAIKVYNDYKDKLIKEPRELVLKPINE